MQNTFKLEIPNLAKLQKAFHSYPSIAGPEFKKGINVVLANIMKRATDEDGGIFQFRTPRSYRTGLLSLSFGNGIKLATDSNLSGSIGPTAWYAKYINNGLEKTWEIKVKNKKALANKKTGQIFGKSVIHPGIKANPFMQRIRDASADDANREMAGALQRVLTKLAV